jgi:MFS family permease
LHQNSDDIYIVDNLVENLPFSLYHYASVLVCLFSMLCDGYLAFHFKMGHQLMEKKFNWTQSNINLLTSICFMTIALGSLISTNSRTIYWDVSSNILIATIGSLCCIMMCFFADGTVYASLLILFAFCHGFIANISTNFLIELMKKNWRGFAFMIIGSMKFLGNFVGAIIFLHYYGSILVDEPGFLSLGLLIFEILMGLSLVFLFDSPRILYCNNEMSLFCDYLNFIDEIPNDNFKVVLVSQILEVRKLEEKKYGSQKNEGVVTSYFDLYKKKVIKKTLIAKIFSVIITIVLIFIPTCFEEYLKYLKIEDQENIFKITNIVKIFANGSRQINYYLLIYYASQLGLAISLCLIFFFAKSLRRIYFTVGSLIACIVLNVLMLCLKSGQIYLFGIFEVFSYFYFLLLFLYITENIITKLRNSLTSIVFIILQFSNILQFGAVSFLSSLHPTVPIYFSLFLCIVLILLEFFLIDFKNNNNLMPLQEIEFKILSSKI